MVLAVLVVVEGVDLACLVRARHEAAEVQRRHLLMVIPLVRGIWSMGNGEKVVRLPVFVEDYSVGEFGHACGDGVIFCRCRCCWGLLLGRGGRCSGLLLLLVNEEMFWHFWWCRCVCHCGLCRW